MGVHSGVFGAVGGILASSGAAAAQYSELGAATLIWLGGPIIAGFLLTVVVGAIMLGTKPRWTRVTTNHLENNVAKSVVIGIATVVIVVILTGVLVATDIGVIIAVPLFLLFVVVVFVGTAITALAIGRVAGEVVGTEGEWAALAIGALCFGVLSVIPILGQLTSFLCTTAGAGIIMVRWFGTP